MKMSKSRRLTECAMMIALATGLSLFKLIDLPAGGSVTAASMLPLVLLAYRHGTRYGLLCGLTHGVLQQLLGLNTLTYATTWQSVIAIILLDYLIAFAVIGFAGVVRKASLPQGTAVSLGALIASVLRYLCHVLSGATVWAGLSIPTEAALVYSLSYNATYMIPETILLICAAAYIGTALDFSSPTLRPLARDAARQDRRTVYGYYVCASVAVAATVALTLLVFPHLQAEGGEFDLSGLCNVPPVATAIAAAALVLAGVGACVLRVFSCKKNEKTV